MITCAAPPKIHPSVLCADHGNLRGEVAKLTKAGVDYFHVDVMDGNFVPNFGCGSDIVKLIKRETNVPIDVHLMIENPSRHVKFFCEMGADIITIHPEADRQAARTLAEIRELGVVPGIAINPGTSVETVKELLPLCGHVLVMTVNPGFGGQKFLEFTIPKIKRLGELSREFGFSLCVDGNIDAEKVGWLKPMGVGNFVVGTALFRDDYLDVIEAIRRVK